MQRQVVDGLPVRLEALEEDERVGLVDTERPVGVGGDEVEWEGEIGRGEEGEGGDGGGVVAEGANGGGVRQVVELDGVIGATGGRGRAGGGDAGDCGEVGWVGEERD